MATSTFDAAAEAKFRNNVAEYNKTAAPEDKHSEADIEQEVNNRRMATAIPGASTIPANTAAEISKGIDTALPATTAVPSPAAPLPATATSQPASSAVAGSPFGFDSEEIKKKLLAYGWVPPAAYGAYELGKKALPSAQQLWGNLSQKMTGSPDVPAPQIEPILDAAPTQSNMDKMRATLKMAPRPEVQTVQDIAEKLTPDQIRQQKMDIATKAAQQQMAASAVPGGAAPVNATPAPVTPSAVEVVTPVADAAITADPVATPAEKAQALVHTPEAAPAETTPPVETTKATPIKGAAVPTAPVAPVPVPEGGYNQRVQQAMSGVPQSVKDQYAKEGKVVLKGYGVGDRSLTNTYGPDAYQTIIEHFNNGQPIGSDENYKAVQKKINAGVPSSLATEFAKKLPGSEAEAGNFAKAFGETGAYGPDGKVVTSRNAIKNAIAAGGERFLAMSPANAQKGNVSIGGIANVGLNALGALGLYHDYQQAKNTGDWSNFGLNAAGQVLGNVLPKAAGIGANLMLHHGEAGAGSALYGPGSNFPEIKTYEQYLQALKTGAGRGMQGVPPSAYNR